LGLKSSHPILLWLGYSELRSGGLKDAYDGNRSEWAKNMIVFPNLFQETNYDKKIIFTRFLALKNKIAKEN
jgi:hypothetical protein